MPRLNVFNEPYALRNGGAGYVSSVGSTSTYSFVQNTGLFTIVGRILMPSMGAAEYGIMGNTTTNANKGFYLSVLTSKAINIVATTGAGTGFNATSPSIGNYAGKWVFFAVRGNGTLNSSIIRFSIGVDGSITHNTPTTTTASLSSGNSANVLGISALTSLGANAFNGSIANLGIWNRYLSDAEIEDVFSKNNYPSNGLVSKWTPNNTTSLVDVIGGYNGTINNLTLVAGPYRLRPSGKDFKHSIFCDGTNNYYVRSNNDLGVSGSQPFSMNVWAYIVKVDYTFNVMCAYGAPSGSPTGYLITIDTSNNIVARLSGATSTPGVAANTYKNKWAMYTLTSDGTTIRFYIDGLFVGSAAISPNITNGRFMVGSDLTGGGAEPFGGYLDEAQAWNVCLTDEEVVNLRQGVDPTGSRASLVYYKMDETMGSSTVTDSSGNGNTGSVTAGLVFSTFVYQRSRLPVGDIPLKIPELSLWLRGDMGLDSSTTTGGLCIWEDSSGNNRHFFQGTSALQPAHVLDGINNLPSIRFDGANDGMSSTAPSGTFLSLDRNAYSYYIVAKPTAITYNVADATAWLNDGCFVDTSGYIGSLLRTAGGGQLFAYHFDSGPKIINHSVSVNETYLHSVRFGSGTLASRKNNGVESTLAASTVGASSIIMNIGYGYTQSRVFTGQIAEIIMFRRRLSDDEDASVRAYLSSRYAIA